jgi:ferredoxin
VSDKQSTEDAASWRVRVDAELCIGSGMCAGIAPEHFELVDGRSRSRRDVIEPDDDALDAAQSCPMEAIAIRDLAAGTDLAP